MNETALLDKAVIVETLGSNDPALICEFYQLFVAHAQSIAPSFGAAFESANLEQLRGLAHQLKSSAASVGAVALARMLRQLEQVARQGDQAGSVALTLQIEQSLQCTVELIQTELLRLQQESPLCP